MYDFHRDVDPKVENNEADCVSRALNRLYNGVKGLSILELGCNESNVGKVLSKDHYVTGVDWRDYEGPIRFIKGDAAKIDYETYFDVIIGISSIEHFGLTRYGDTQNENGDIEALQQAYKNLVPGGYCLLTVPIIPGDTLVVRGTEARFYSKKDILERLVQDNTLEYWESVNEKGVRVCGGMKEFEQEEFNDIAVEEMVFLQIRGKDEGSGAVQRT